MIAVEAGNGATAETGGGTVTREDTEIGVGMGIREVMVTGEVMETGEGMGTEEGRDTVIAMAVAAVGAATEAAGVGRRLGAVGAGVIVIMNHNRCQTNLLTR